MPGEAARSTDGCQCFLTDEMTAEAEARKTLLAWRLSTALEEHDDVSHGVFAFGDVILTVPVIEAILGL
jgi:hypothetical protein